MSEKTIETLLADEAATIEFGRSLAAKLQVGTILSLVGDLGAGKTTLVKGIAEGLGGSAEDISSPTFSIVHEHSFSNFEVLHCDFYRLESEDELADLGGLEFFFQEKIYIIEWLEHSGLIDLINKDRILTLQIESKENSRLIRFLNPVRNS